MNEEEDELENSLYFNLLKNEYHKKYQRAIDNGWTICVPVGTRLAGIPIDESFVDQHLLRPTRLPNHFVSTYSRELCLHKIEKNVITFIGRAKHNMLDDQDDPVDEEVILEDILKYNIDAETDDFCTRILSIEKGYNNQHQPYNILIVEHPILSSYRDPPENDDIVTALVEDHRTATEFLLMLSEKKTFCLSEAENILSYLKSYQYKDVQDMKNVIKHIIQSNWAIVLRRHSNEYQRDARFQKRLSLALEIYVLHGLHKIIYDKISEDFNEYFKDYSHLKEKIDALNAAGATPDQLGVRKDLAIMLAYGVVELANLDATIGPHARLNCLKSSFEMAIAEIKGAVAESASKNDTDDEVTLNMTIMPEDLIQICTYLIVKCKCYTLFQDLYYIENFVFSLNPADKAGYILTVYKSALENIDKIDTNNLPARNKKIKTEMDLDDLSDYVLLRNNLPHY
ncbi:uncharacterized protein LOC100678817 [Nasonia vitripennis]|uniref:VPS9 domain-containing protein n=1 Tax=Nasonia vitripennis TaxID=7425 RepID=A0A7M7LKS5_NASVI|nr:uncharacterized protein LOC100678817 [Nasonia vitripennis]